MNRLFKSTLLLPLLLQLSISSAFEHKKNSYVSSGNEVNDFSLMARTSNDIESNDAISISNNIDNNNIYNFLHNYNSDYYYFSHFASVIPENIKISFNQHLNSLSESDIHNISNINVAELKINNDSNYLALQIFIITLLGLLFTTYSFNLYLNNKSKFFWKVKIVILSNLTCTLKKFISLLYDKSKSLSINIIINIFNKKIYTLQNI